ncbi:MAG: DUF2065 domain-containing protein [Pseudomonadota bacterium]
MVLTVFLLALGLMCIFEGLLMALAPARLEEALRILMSLPEDTRRMIGMLAITTGGILMTLGALTAG